MRFTHESISGRIVRTGQNIYFCVAVATAELVTFQNSTPAFVEIDCGCNHNSRAEALGCIRDLALRYARMKWIDGKKRTGPYIYFIRNFNFATEYKYVHDTVEEVKFPQWNIGV